MAGESHSVLHTAPSQIAPKLCQNYFHQVCAQQQVTNVNHEVLLYKPFQIMTGSELSGILLLLSAGICSKQPKQHKTGQ